MTTYHGTTIANDVLLIRPDLACAEVFSAIIPAWSLANGSGGFFLACEDFLENVTTIHFPPALFFFFKWGLARTH